MLRRRAGSDRCLARRRSPDPSISRLPLSPPPNRADLSPHLVAELSLAVRGGAAAAGSGPSLRYRAARGSDRHRWLCLRARCVVGCQATDSRPPCRSRMPIPGLATRWLSRRVRHVYLGLPEARRLLRFGPNTEVFDTGNPITPPKRDRRGAALAKFGVDGSRPVVLVTGGSQGALAINRAVAGLSGCRRARLCNTDLGNRTRHLR